MLFEVNCYENMCQANSPEDMPHNRDIQITPSSSNSPSSYTSSFDNNHAEFQLSKSKKVQKTNQSIKRRKIKDITELETINMMSTYKVDQLNETPNSLSTSQSSFTNTNSPMTSSQSFNDASPTKPSFYPFPNDQFNQPKTNELSSINTIFDTNHTIPEYMEAVTYYHQEQPEYNTYYTNSFTSQDYLIDSTQPKDYCNSQVQYHEYPNQYHMMHQQSHENNEYISQLPMQNIYEGCYENTGYYLNSNPVCEMSSYNSHNEQSAAYMNQNTEYASSLDYQHMSTVDDNDSDDNNYEDDDSDFEESMAELDMFTMTGARKYQKTKKTKKQQLEEDLNPNDMSVGAKRKRKRILNRLQRAEATMREKRRMLKLNKAFEELRKVLPISEFAKNKLSRAETLKSAIEYIEKMSEMLTIS